MINYEVGERVKYAMYLLLWEAKYWWKNTILLMESTPKVVNQESLRGNFLDKSFWISTITKLVDDFLKLYQGNMINGEYKAKFELFSRHFKFYVKSLMNILRTTVFKIK